MGAAALVQSDQAMSPFQRGANIIEFQRRKRAKVEEIEGLFVLAGEIIADLLGDQRHLTVGDKGRMVSGAKSLRRPNIVIIGIPSHRVFSTTIEPFVFEEQDRIVVLVCSE